MMTDYGRMQGGGFCAPKCVILALEHVETTFGDKLMLFNSTPSQGISELHAIVTATFVADFP